MHIAQNTALSPSAFCQKNRWASIFHIGKTFALSAENTATVFHALLRPKRTVALRKATPHSLADARIKLTSPLLLGFCIPVSHKCQFRSANTPILPLLHCIFIHVLCSILILFLRCAKFLPECPPAADFCILMHRRQVLYPHCVRLLYILLYQKGARWVFQRAP